MIRLGRLCVFFVLMCASLSVFAQQPSQDSVLTFHFVHAGVPVPEYTFKIHADGTGTYAASYATPVMSSKYASAYPSQSAAPIETTSAITLSPKTTSALFERVRGTDHFRGGCESRLKNIADTGTKTLSYAGPDGNALCSYNFTEDKAIAAITNTFQGIAETLDEGRSIDQKHRYDRLGLDKELATLAESVHSGRALEIAVIAPVLQSLCDDTEVMDRVRKRAAGLLQASASTR